MPVSRTAPPAPVPPIASIPQQPPVVVASGTHSRHSSPSLTLSAAPSSNPSPRLPQAIPQQQTSFSVTPSGGPARQQTHSTLARPQSVHPAYSSSGDPVAALDVSSPRSAATSRTASTALRDDPPESPRPRKRARLQSRDFDETRRLKFDSSAETEIDPEADMHDSSRISATTVKNGIAKDSTNGVAPPIATNGAVKNGTPLNDEFFGHSREEVTRLMMQALHDLGYSYYPIFFLARLLIPAGMPPKPSPTNQASISSRSMSLNFEMRPFLGLGPKRNYTLPAFPCKKMRP